MRCGHRATSRVRRVATRSVSAEGRAAIAYPRDDADMSETPRTGRRPYRLDRHRRRRFR
jgi:hypothetical protein